MNPRSVVPVPALVAVALVGIVGIATRTANAAQPTGASCAPANDQSIKLRTDKKLRAARDQAQLCAAASCSAKLRKACQKRVADLATAIPTIVFLVKDSAGHDVSGVKVSLDGDSLADHLDGTALSVDPGQHTFTFETAGIPPYDQSFLIIEGQKDRHETITLPPPAPAPPPSPPAAPVVGTADEATTHSSAMKPVALVLGGVGLVTLIVGGVTGALAVSKWHDSESECGTATECPNHSQSVTDHNTASSLAAVSTVTLIAGGAALAAGVTLFFVAPKATDERSAQGVSLRVDPLLGPGVEGFTLEGRF